MNINTMLENFAKISTEIKATTANIKENEFVARLVICYKENDKTKNIENYNKTIEFTKELDKLSFNYKIKENKYVYLLHKTEFENDTQFLQVQKMFAKKIDNENNKINILTINLNNFNTCQNFLKLALQILQENRKQTNK